MPSWSTSTPLGTCLCSTFAAIWFRGWWGCHRGCGQGDHQPRLGRHRAGSSRSVERAVTPVGGGCAAVKFDADSCRRDDPNQVPRCCDWITVGHFRASPTRNFAMAHPTKPKHTPTRNSPKPLRKPLQNNPLKNCTKFAKSGGFERNGPQEHRYDICGIGEVNRFKRKTPQNMALSGVFVVAAESLQPISWRRRRDSNP